MAKEFKVDQKLKIGSMKVVVTAVDPSTGNATIHYAKGSGKTGYAGTLKSSKSGKVSLEFDNISLTELADNDSITLEDYYSAPATKQRKRSEEEKEWDKKYGKSAAEVKPSKIKTPVHQHLSDVLKDNFGEETPLYFKEFEFKKNRDGGYEGVIAFGTAKDAYLDSIKDYCEVYVETNAKGTKFKFYNKKLFRKEELTDNDLVEMVKGARHRRLMDDKYGVYPG